VCVCEKERKKERKKEREREREREVVKEDQPKVLSASRSVGAFLVKSRRSNFWLNDRFHQELACWFTVAIFVANEFALYSVLHRREASDLLCKL
jgi:hypothetical protein